MEFLKVWVKTLIKSDDNFNEFYLTVGEIYFINFIISFELAFYVRAPLEMSCLVVDSLKCKI